MNFQEKRLSDFLNEHIPSASPSIQVRAYLKGEKRIDIKCGESFEFYDLASLTKIIFTNTAVMLAWQENKIDLDSHIQKYCPFLPFKGPKIKELLYHCSGFPWWDEFYKRLMSDSELEAVLASQQKLNYLLQWKKLENELAKCQVQKVEKSVYSDIDYMFLAFVLEKVYRKDLVQIWLQLKRSFMLETCNFHINNIAPYPKQHYAPTENCPWRKRVLQAEVHDDNTWSLGGVSTHAGLFGSILDLSNWALKIRKAYLGQDDLIKQKTMAYFASRQIDKSIGDWALGFMMPTEGSASCGQYFSAESIGHTAFTGCSFWFDPKVDLLVCILSNRVHPSRENKTFVGLRPQIHDKVYEILLK